MSRCSPIREKPSGRGALQRSAPDGEEGKRRQDTRYRGTHSRQDRGRNGVYAAVDLGTNNCRLLVAQPTDDGFRVIDAFSRIVRLGEGLSRNGRLSESAMKRTVDALRICASKTRRRHVTRMRAVATEACRRAENCTQFLHRVYAETGIQLEIISSNEEARLALHGCAQLLDPTIRHALVFDIGGGSTELSWLEIPMAAEGRGVDEKSRLLAEEARLIAWHSVPKGVVTLAEHYGGHSVTPEVYEAMVEEMHAAIQPFELEHGLRRALERGRIQMLGTSGTVTTLAGVHQDLPRYDRAAVDGCYMGFDTVREVSERIAAMSYDERAGHPCIGRERADLVVAGCAILEALCRTWPVGRLRVADRGLREGILHNL
ncbi:MAG: Ppx/GppA phosphatase family protein, partial [Rhodovibrionaceae bacterium]|nr:Ppx/GppA phosphatase family protein [Rhodovibrionaceae bacterium]